MKKNGFSLVELMVGMTVGIIVIFMVISVYISSKRNHAQNNQYNDLLENARYAVNTISNEIKHAGFMGGVSEFADINLDDSLVLDNDCGISTGDWVYDLTTYGAIQTTNNATAAQANTNHDCIETTEFLTGTNVLVVKRAYGVPVTSLKDNTVYVRSDNLTACLWYYEESPDQPTGGACPTANFLDWQYLTTVFYIRPYAVTPGDDIPMLCKKVISATTGSPPEPTMSNVCLAKGVEYFKVLYGVDTDSVPDGVVNTYKESPTIAELNKTVTARIFVLTRSKNADANYSNTKTYNLGGYTITKNDNFYRKVFVTTVSLPNVISKMRL